MEKSEIFNIVKKDLIHKYNLNETKFNYNTNIQNEVLVDSLGIVELSIYIEELFDIIVSDDELFNCKNVQDMINLIYKEMEKNNGK